ncbi:MAG: hypothetical protein GOU98_03500 [Candidatus Altiarchaeota archaeon]|nr:hypothetical protein [Candidatus Altiarchaeota archaeon]
MKAVVCDSSSIITLSSNCLLWVFDKFDAEFLIPNYVKKEIVDNPLKTKRFAFEAMRNSMAINKSLKVVETNKELLNKIIELSNKLLSHKGRTIEIIQYGEADALALAIEKGLKTLLVDEKNTRLMIEDKERLRKVIEKRTGKSIEIDTDVSRDLEKMLKGMKVIRSSELLAIAIKRNIIDWPFPKREILKSVLTSAKYSGCAVSSEEIHQIIDAIEPHS